MRGKKSSVDTLLSIQLNLSLLGVEYMLCSELDAVKDIKSKK